MVKQLFNPLLSDSVALQTLIGYICMVMIGAAIMLWFTVPTMLTGVVVQGLPPLIALSALLLQRTTDRTDNATTHG